MNTGVYLIYNKVTKKRYIGSTCSSFEKRWYMHVYGLEIGKHKNKHLQAAWNKYGKDSFLFKVLKRCEPEEVLKYEQYYIDKYNSSDRAFGYNKAPKAGNSRGIKRSRRTRRLISERVKNVSFEVRQRMNAAARNPERNKIISEKLKGTKRKASTKRKLSKIVKQWWIDNPIKRSKEHLAALHNGLKRWREEHPEEVIKAGKKVSKKLKGRPGAMLGKKHSEEAKKKMSLAKIGRRQDPEAVAKRTIALRQAYIDRPELRIKMSRIVRERLSNAKSN